ncbi:MAG: protein kinase [Oscillospiraceae bacterium]|nr:protein kinase [Oscillospiraceae bacterium]
MFKQGELLNGTYKITESIGSGGGGEIYKAYHTHLKCNVAIKRIKDEIKGKIDERTEVDILTKIKHPFLPQVYDFVITDEGEIYTVMEFIEGSSFQELMKDGKRFTQAQILKYAKQICDALCYLHSRKPAIVHSDIKPANIMLTPEDNICIIDFNISSVLSEGGAFAVGKSDGYSPPEQYIKKNKNFSQDEKTSFYETDIYTDKTEIALADETEVMLETPRYEQKKPDTTASSSYVSKAIVSRAIIDERSDIYALGATLYYLLTGKKPEKSIDHVTPLKNVDKKIRKGFLYIIGKAMQKSPDKRYQSVSEMIKDIENIDRIERKEKGKGVLKVAGFIALGLAIVGCIGALIGIVATAEPTKKIETSQEDAGKEYNADGTYNEYEYNANGKVSKKFVYSPDGKILKETKYHDNGSYDVYDYNTNEQCIKESCYNVKKALKRYFIYEYEKGKLTKKYRYNVNVFSIGIDRIFEYDSNGYLVKESAYNYDERLLYYYKYEYDSNGNIVEKSVYNLYGRIERKTIYNPDGSVKNEYTY